MSDHDWEPRAERHGIAGHDQQLAKARDVLRASPAGFVLFTLDWEGEDVLTVEPLISMPAWDGLAETLRNFAAGLEQAATVLDAEGDDG